MEERQRLYVDMDGTLAVFTPVDTLETLYEKGYFANLVPHENVVAAVQDIIKNHPEVEVHILSAYLTDSQYALNEKNEWLDKYLPEIDQAHRVFVPCGSDKKDGIEGGIRQNDFLLDDYTHNLNDWQPPARGIKLLNAINHTKGSWEHDRIRFDREPHSLAEGIVSIMQGREKIFDERINKPMDNREREFLENLARFEYMRGESNIFPVYEPLSQATNPTAREVYQAEYDRVANLATEQPRMVVLTSEMVGYRNAPHDIAYNKAMTDRQMDRYEENKTAFLEDVYSRLGNRGVQPSDYYGHSPSVGDAVVVMKSDGTETHYVDTVGFEEEADVSKVMTEEQQKAAKMGLDVRSEWDMLQSIDEYARVYGNEQLYEAVEAETMGRMDFMRDNYMGVFNLAEIRGTIENESDKLEFLYRWEEDNGIADPLVLGEEDGHYYVSQDAIRAAMPDTRLANGNYVSDDARIVAGERLKANIDYRFERAATEFARENPSFYRFEASPTPLGDKGQYDAFVQKYDRTDTATAIPRDIVFVGEPKIAAEVSQHLNAGTDYGQLIQSDIELRSRLGEDVLTSENVLIDDLEHDIMRLTDLYAERFDRMQRAMSVGGYEYDGLDSSEDRLVFSGEYGTRMEFENVHAAEEWLESVVFDDPEVSDRVERVMHPERFEQSLEQTEQSRSALTPESDNIKVEGHTGTWYVIDSEEINGKQLHLLESEQYGDEAANLIVDEQGSLVMEDVWNGFDDYREMMEAMDMVRQGDDLSHGATEVMGNPEYYRFFYDNEPNHAERNELMREQGWKGFWGDDAQGLNGGTWVVYRDISDLPVYLQEYAREMEQYQPMPNHYYEPDLDLDGTAEELFIQARNGYIESPEALAKVQEILSNPVENKPEQAFYVGVLKEIAEDKGEEPYVFAQMKKDILDGVHPEEVSLRDGLTMEVLRDGNDSVVIDLRDYSAEDDASFIGGHSMSQDEFLKMNAQEFKELVNSIYAYNMVEQELDYEMERENERPFEEAAIEEPTEEKLTLHIQYQEPINMNGWVAEKDTITFDSREEMDKFISGDSAYDALDNAVSKKDNEILLYAVNEQNETVWISPEYAKSQAQEEVAKWEALKAVDPSKVICFDLETTGLDRKEDEILQLSVIDGNRNVLFNDYIRPTAHESWEQAQAVNGISPEMVADKQTIEEHRDRLNGIFANAELIVGYNHEYFDMEMLRNAGVTIPEATKSFDVMKEYAPIHGEWNEERGNYKWQKLQVCAEHYGFEPENGYHDSLEDVKATMHSFDGMVAEQSKEAYRDLAEATGAYEHLAERIDTFMYDNDYYEYSDNIGIDEEQRSISRESIAMDLRDGSNIPAMIETLQDMRELEHIDRDATAMREVNDLIYSLQNMEQYVQCYGNENRTPNTEHAVQEFRDRQGFMREGDQIAMVMSQIPNFSDRSIPFRAVQEFEDRNNLPEKERTIIDGGYEDKDFLYMAYDRYVAMSHQNDLSIQPYMEQITDLTKDRQYQYASPLPMIAEVYYAQQNGLSKEQIEYALEAVKDEKFPSDSFRNYRRGFEDGLTMEQMDVFKGEKDSTQEYLMEFMADGGSVEDAKALKGCDVAQYYLLKDPLKNGEMSREMAQAIIQSVNGIVEKSYEDYKAAVAENPDARPRFSSFDGEFFTEYFADAVQNDKNITPEMVMTVAREFSEQTATDRLSDFVKERGGFAAVSHRATEQQQETKKEEVAEERGVEMPVSKVDEKEVSKGVSLPEEKKDPKELLTAKLQQGVQEVLNSEKFKSWLDTSSKLFMNNYSFNNAMLVWMQRPDASHTMGYEQWKDYGRAVAQGSTGIKIFVPVIAYEKKDGDLWRMIKSNLTAQMKNDPSLTQATYRVGMSKLEITMNQNNLYGLRVGGVEQGIRSEKDMQDFIKHNVVGKVPMYFSVGTVFDAKDTITPEYLWVKKGYTKDEVVKGEDGKPIKNRKGEVKIVNTPERQARFNPSLDMSVPQKDPQKMAILYDALKAVSERNGIPVFERERDSDDTLKGGADGYYSRDFSEYPKGYIVMPTDLDPTKRVSVMLHEMTHSELHGNLEKLAQDMGEENVPRKMREIQAEAVAYTVGKQFGIDTDTSSFQYLAAYTSGFELQALSKSIEVIYKECQQVTKELEAELAIRGLNRDLTDRFNSPMEQEAVDTICKSYAEYACTQMERLESITAELPAIAKQSEGNDKALDVMVEKVNNIARQNEDVSIIFAGIESIRSADTLDGQKDAIGIIEAAKERIEGDKAQFAELSSKYQEAMQSEQNLHSRFVSAPMATLEAMKQDYPQLEQLTTSQMQYLAKSEYVSRDLVPLLKSDPQTFVDKACERAAEIDKVASKNGMFVEVAFCEQWTDKPIVSDGALMHPKVAETIVKQAETQIRSLKAQAEQTGDYFPYSKCALTVFKAEKGQITDAFKTRVDIGDGSQSSLSDHLKQFSSAKDIAVDFEKATREKGAKEKIVFNDAVKEAVSHGATEVAEVADKPSKGMSKEDWMEEIGKVRQAQQQENANNSQQQEQQSNRNAKNDKTH